MKIKRLSYLRRAVQITSFFLLLYTSLFFVGQIDVPGLPFVNVPKELERPDWYAPTTKYVEVFDTYLPIKSCRFIADESRAFRACFLHFANESIIWLSPPEEWLPHVALFLVLVFLFGRAWCGWVCPLGFISEVLFWIRGKLGIRERRLSSRIKNFMSIFRYGFVSVVLLLSILLILPLGLSSFQGELAIINCETCPARNIFPLFAGVLPSGFSFGNQIYVIFGFIGIAFLIIYFSGFLVKRPWCRICPSGAIISFFNLSSVLSKEKETGKCTSCGVCERMCPMDNINTKQKEEKSINTANCIRCFRCVEHCPEKDCLKIKFAGKTIYKSKYKPN